MGRWVRNGTRDAKRTPNAKVRPTALLMLTTKDLEHIKLGDLFKMTYEEQLEEIKNRPPTTVEERRAFLRFLGIGVDDPEEPDEPPAQIP